jgi:hypothetical protein
MRERNLLFSYPNNSNGAVPKWLKGPVLKTGRGESLREFKSLLLRQNIQVQALYATRTGFVVKIRLLDWKRN